MSKAIQTTRLNGNRDAYTTAPSTARRSDSTNRKVTARSSAMRSPHNLVVLVTLLISAGCAQVQPLVLTNQSDR